MNTYSAPIMTEIMTLAETAQYLKVSEKTVHRLISDNAIPCVKIGGQWRFMKSMIDNWLESQMNVIPQSDFLKSIQAQKEMISLARLIEPSCVFLDLFPGTPARILKTLCASLKQCGAVSDDELFLNQLLEREKLMSTGIGRGIALPHPRKAGEPPVEQSALAVGYCPRGIDFASLDGMKTHLFMVIASHSEPLHLRVLSMLTRIAGDGDFVQSVGNLKTPSEFIRLLIEKEADILV